MTDVSNVQDLIGRTAVDTDGAKIGKIEQIYLDDQSSDPVWVTVSTGLFGNKQSFAPLYGSSMSGDDLQLAVTKDQVKDAPNVDADGHLEDSENDALYSHYAGHLGEDTATPQYQSSAEHDVTGGGAAQGYDTAATTGRDTEMSEAGETAVTTEGQDTSGPNTDNAMTRSEEQLHVGTEKVEAGRARLRKYVVTENVTQTVPVSHEEVRIEREPITDANRGDAPSGGDITEEEHEITLHAERPVVSKETVPVERVTLGTETVTEEQTVNEEIRKEQIDTPDADTTGTGLGSSPDRQ